MTRPGLAKYILTRLAHSAPILLGASLVTFFLVRAAGDPLTKYRLTPGVTAKDVLAREHSMGLDAPLFQQYLDWIWNALQGDFGDSLTIRTPVLELIWERLPATLELMGAAVLLTLLIAVPLGVMQARRRGGRFDRGSSALTTIALSTPVFWLALILQIGLGYYLSQALGFRVFFTAGQSSPGVDPTLLDSLQHLALPLFTLVIAQVAVWSRYQRASYIEALTSRHLFAVRALGVPERRLITRFALPMSLAPLLAVVAIDLPLLFGGTVVVESVFAWPGMGSLLIGGIEKSDYPLVMGILMITAVLVILFNLLADVGQRLLDPRGESSQ